jgi:hypothetical protein
MPSSHQRDFDIVKNQRAHEYLITEKIEAALEDFSPGGSSGFSASGLRSVFGGQLESQNLEVIEIDKVYQWNGENNDNKELYVAMEGQDEDFEFPSEDNLGVLWAPVESAIDLVGEGDPNTYPEGEATTVSVSANNDSESIDPEEQIFMIGGTTFTAADDAEQVAEKLSDEFGEATGRIDQLEYIDGLHWAYSILGLSDDEEDAIPTFHANPGYDDSTLVGEGEETATLGYEFHSGYSSGIHTKLGSTWTHNDDTEFYLKNTDSQTGWDQVYPIEGGASVHYDSLGPFLFGEFSPELIIDLPHAGLLLSMQFNTSAFASDEEADNVAGLAYRIATGAGDVWIAQADANIGAFVAKVLPTITAYENEYPILGAEVSTLSVTIIRRDALPLEGEIISGTLWLTIVTVSS